MNSISTIEKVFVRTGRITTVRVWDGAGLHELHLHLPNVEFDEWNKAQSIKCRISPLHYVDYTPATWDAAKKTCTLYVDTSHSGRGSEWTKNQRQDDPFYYLKIEEESHFPVSEKSLVFLGDQTAIGHFCAIQQLASRETAINGCVVFNDLQTANAMRQNCPWLPVQTVVKYELLYDYAAALVAENNRRLDNTVFYVVGNARLIVSVRKILKSYGIDGGRVKSKGFWQ